MCPNSLVQALVGDDIAAQNTLRHLTGCQSANLLFDDCHVGEMEILHRNPLDAHCNSSATAASRASVYIALGIISRRQVLMTDRPHKFGRKTHLGMAG